MNYDQDLKLRLSEILPPGTKKGIYNNRKYRHILPLFDDDRQITKREAIRKYTGIDILPELLPESEYHRDIHHLTSVPAALLQCVQQINQQRRNKWGYGQTL